VNPILRGASAHVIVDNLEVPELDEHDAHHLFRVLRLRPGAVVTATDGAGRWRECRAEGGNGIVPNGSVVTEARANTALGVAFVPVKAEKPETTIRQLVELGIDEIFVLAPTRRSVAGSRDRLNDRADRIVREACMQSRRVFLPTVHLGVHLVDVCALGGAALADPNGGDIGDARILIVGPEGGFESDEVADGLAKVSIGPAVLRAETAAIVAGARLVARYA